MTIEQERLTPTQEDRDVELKRLREFVLSMEGEIANILARIEDEGDRAFLGSTNDVDKLAELSRGLEHECYRIMGAIK